MQGYVLAVKVDGLVFATCLAAEDVSFLFLRIISALVIYLAHDSLKGLLLERLVKLLHALPICPRLHDSRQLASLLFGGVNGFGLGTSVLSSCYSGEGGRGYFLTFVCRTQVGIRFICVHITLCGELHRPFVHPFFSTSPLFLEPIEYALYIWVTLRALPIRKSAVWPHQLPIFHLRYSLYQHAATRETSQL